MAVFGVGCGSGNGGPSDLGTGPDQSGPSDLGTDPDLGGGTDLGSDPDLGGGTDLGSDPDQGGGTDLGTDGGINPPVQLTNVFGGVTTGQPITVTVQLNDENGNPDTASTELVTLSLEANPGFNIIHQGGNGERVLDLIDVASSTMLYVIASDVGDDEITGMVYRAASGVIYGAERAPANLNLIDPFTGAYTRIGEPDLLDNYYRGLAFNGVGELLAASQSTPEIWTIDTTTGDDSLRTAVTLAAGGTLLSFNGFARDPSSGTFYGVIKLGGQSGYERFLVTIQVGAGAATLVGQLPNGTAALAFSPAGQLFVVTGDGGDPGEQLYRVDKTTGAATLVMDVTIGDDGDSIVAVPARLGGELTRAAVAGVATFQVWATAPGVGYAIRATRASDNAFATSPAFDVTSPVTTATVSFSAATSTVGEADGTHQVAFVLSAAQPHHVWATWENTLSGSAVRGLHVELPTFGSVMIPAGSTSGQLTVTILDDAEADGPKELRLALRHVGLGAVGSETLHTITIEDND